MSLSYLPLKNRTSCKCRPIPKFFRCHVRRLPFPFTSNRSHFTSDDITHPAGTALPLHIM